MYTAHHEQCPATRESHGSTLRRVVYAWELARSGRAHSTRFFDQALQSDVADNRQGTAANGHAPTAPIPDSAS